MPPATDPTEGHGHHQTSQQTHNKTESYSSPDYGEEAAQDGEYPLSAADSQQRVSPTGAADEVLISPA